MYKEPYKTKTVETFDKTQPDSLLGVVKLHIKKARNRMRCFLINMELSNGDHTHFLAFPDQGKFKFLDGHYIIDESLKYYDLASKLYCLDFHQEISFPIRRRIDATAIKKTVVLLDSNTVMSYNPKTLDLVIQSEVIQKVLQGAELEKVFDFLKKVGIATLLIVVIILVMMLQESGMLNKLPFFG